MTDYKTYAENLYDIKLATTCKPKENTITALEAYLIVIHDLHQKFRLELNDLMTEFILENSPITHQGIEEIKVINEQLIKKMQALAYPINTKIKKLRGNFTN